MHEGWRPPVPHSLSLGLYIQPVFFVSVSWHLGGLAQQLGYYCSLHDAADGRSSVPWVLGEHLAQQVIYIGDFQKLGPKLSEGLDCKKKYGIPWMKFAGCVIRLNLHVT